MSGFLLFILIVVIIVRYNVTDQNHKHDSEILMMTLSS